MCRAREPPPAPRPGFPSLRRATSCQLKDIPGSSSVLSDTLLLGLPPLRDAAGTHSTGTVPAVYRPAQSARPHQTPRAGRDRGSCPCYAAEGSIATNHLDTGFSKHFAREAPSPAPSWPLLPSDGLKNSMKRCAYPR